MDNRGSAYSAKKKRGWPPGGCRALVGGKGVTPHYLGAGTMERVGFMGEDEIWRVEKVKWG